MVSTTCPSSQKILTRRVSFVSVPRAHITARALALRLTWRVWALCTRIPRRDTYVQNSLSRIARTRTATVCFCCHQVLAHSVTRIFSLFPRIFRYISEPTWQLLSSGSDWIAREKGTLDLYSWLEGVRENQPLVVHSSTALPRHPRLPGHIRLPHHRITLT
jgi:hypothetical protein